MALLTSGQLGAYLYWLQNNYPEEHEDWVESGGQRDTIAQLPRYAEWYYTSAPDPSSLPTPTGTAGTTGPPGGPPGTAQPTWNDIVALSTSGLPHHLDLAYNYVSQYFPNRKMEWLYTYGMQSITDDPSGISWIMTQQQSYEDAGVFIMPDGTLVDMTTGTPSILSTPEEEAGPTPGRIFYGAQGGFAVFKNPDGSFEDELGGFISPDDAELIRDAWLATLQPEEPDTGLPPGATPGRVMVADNLYLRPDGVTYETYEGEVVGEELASAVILDSMAGLEPDIDPLTGAIQVAPGIYQLPDETYIDQGGIPIDTNTAELAIQDYLNSLQPEEEESPYPVGLPEGATSAIPGELWFDPATGTYYTVSGNVAYPIDEATAQSMIDAYNADLSFDPNATTDFQNQQLEIQRKELELYAQNLTYQAQLEQDKMKLEYAQYLAGLAANPAAFLEYAVASGQSAAVQPWMNELDPTGQLQTGQQLPGWGPSPTGSPFNLPPIPDYGITWDEIPMGGEIPIEAPPNQAVSPFSQIPEGEMIEPYPGIPPSQPSSPFTQIP